MKSFMKLLIAISIGVWVVSTAFAQTDFPGSKDYPGISRMPTFIITYYKVAEFDSFAFPTTENNKEKSQTVEGKVYTYRYLNNEGAKQVSALQIIRNYQNATRSQHGKILYETPAGENNLRTTIRLSYSQKLWIE
jgi:hypothetical protein